MQKQLDRIEEKLDDLTQKFANLDGRTFGIALITGAMASAILGAALVLLSGCTGGYFPALGQEESADEFVVALVDSAGVPYCSGFQSEGYVITAAHCVDNGPLRVGYHDTMRDENSWENVLEADLLAVNTTMDVAILSSRYAQYDMRLRERPVAVGEHITAIGHAARVPYQHSHGQVSHTTRGALPVWPIEPFFTTDTILVPGMSGGPVLDSQGLVVGVVSFTFGLGGVVPSRSISELLSSLRSPAIPWPDA